MKSIYESFNELTLDDFKEMSPEEISFWFGVGQQQEQIQKMRSVLINQADVKDAKTIKIGD